MEYSFSINDIGRAQANVNMEAEAFGHWLSIDMSAHADADLLTLASVVDELLNRRRYDYHYQGREFYLALSRDKVKVSANSLAGEQNWQIPTSVMDDNWDSDDRWDTEDNEEALDAEFSDAHSGLVASCGLEDFKTLLLAWIAYLHELNKR